MIEKFELNEEEIQSNYDEFIKFIEKAFSGERKEKLLFMYSENELGMEASIAPASVASRFHLSHPGGYLQHVMHVVKNSLKIKKLWEEAGAKIEFSDEELLFSSHAHDIGKLGSKEFGSYYSIQDQDWLIRKGEPYKLNPSNQYMKVTDRALFTLQQYGIKTTWREMLAIKLSDGLFDPASEPYLKTYKEEFYLKTHLPEIIHQADLISCRSEHDSWANPKETNLMVEQE